MVSHFFKCWSMNRYILPHKMFFLFVMVTWNACISTQKMRCREKPRIDFIWKSPSCHIKTIFRPNRNIICYQRWWTRKMIQLKSLLYLSVGQRGKNAHQHNCIWNYGTWLFIWKEKLLVQHDEFRSVLHITRKVYRKCLGNAVKYENEYKLNMIRVV